MTTAPAPAERVGISTISFRFRPLDEALRLIAGTGAHEIDLGAIPDVTDHVPVPFTGDAADYARRINGAGLRCGAVNADPGDLNDPALAAPELRGLVVPLADLAAACGAALIVPAGRASWDAIADHDTDLERIAGNLRLIADECDRRGVRLLVEVLHHRRYLHTVEAAEELLDRCGPEVFGLLFDVSHVVASAEDPLAWIARRADRIERVHLRDAVPGNLNLSIGAGDVDFGAVIAALENAAFTGSYILELETHDIEESAREADVRRSHAEISRLLATRTA